MVGQIIKEKKDKNFIILKKKKTEEVELLKKVLSAMQDLNNSNVNERANSNQNLKAGYEENYNFI